MHPYAILQGLRRELERLDKTADDYAARVKAIEEEIAANVGLERPVTAPEAADTVVDHDAVYLAGLRSELERNPGNEKEISAEISRVEKLIAKRRDSDVDEQSEKPSADEIEQRKQARTGRRAERATAAPGEQRGDEQSEKSE